MVIWKGLLRYPWGQPKLSSQLKMRLKSGKTTCFFNHAILLVALWYSIYVLLAQIRTTWVAYLLTYLSTYNTLLRKIRISTDSKFRWKSVELPKLKNFSILLDKIQWTYKSSHKDIRTTIFVLRCKRKAKQFEAHSIYKSLLGTKIFSNKTKFNYV